MRHYITNVVIYFLILVFMYVILLRDTIIEGKKKGAGIKKTVSKAKDKVVDKVGTVVEVAKDSYNTVKDSTTEIAGDVIGAVGGILGDALTKLLSAVNKLDSTFESM